MMSKRALGGLLGAMVVGLVGIGPATQHAARGADQDGWRPLFNGKDFTGWQNRDGGKPGKGWTIEDGALARKGPAGDLWTKDRFGNFVLDLEFKTEGNSGVFIRTGNPKDNVQTGLEIQVITPSKQPNKHSCGALYDALAPTKEASKAGQWNHVVITAQGSHISVVMNGQKVLAADLDRWTAPGKNPDGTKNKYRTALKDFPRVGQIGLQDHGANVWYRNIRLKPLAK